MLCAWSKYHQDMVQFIDLTVGKSQGIISAIEEQTLEDEPLENFGSKAWAKGRLSGRCFAAPVARYSTSKPP